MRLLPIILALGMSALTAVAQQRSANDSYKTPVSVWSIYVQGGASGYHGFNGTSVCNGKHGVEPEVMLGTKCRFLPWMRAGLNLGYTGLTASSYGAATEEYTVPNYPIGQTTGNVKVTESRLMDINRQQLLGADLSIDFNILQIWPDRKAKSLNLWAGFGVGGMNAWNRRTVTTAISKEGSAGSELYMYANLNSKVSDNTVFSLYIPSRLSLEYDIDPRWTIGISGHYDYLPQNKTCSPTGIWGADAVIRLNFFGKGYKSTARRLDETLSELRNMQDRVSAYAAKIAAKETEATVLRNENERLEYDNEMLNGENAALEKKVNDLSVKLSVYEAAPDYTVKFVINSSKLNPLEEEMLSIFIGSHLDADETFVIVGEASNSGDSHIYNDKLSVKRTDAVKSFLLSKGVEESRIISSSIGDSAAGDESYRRVTIKLK